MAIQTENQPIFPYQGLGRLRFSITRNEARSLLSGTPQPFRKGVLDPVNTDAYYEQRMRLSYDAEDRLEFIETFPPCLASLDGLIFLGAPQGDIIAAMQVRGYTAILGETGECTFPDVGIALYIPENVESVAIYRRGYYEKCENLYREYYSRL